LSSKKTEKKADTKSAKVMGRPVLKIDWDQFDKLAAIHCTKAEIADFFDISEATLDRRVKEEYGITFEAHRKRKASAGRRSLRRKQYEAAMAGNTGMMVWLGKQWLGQAEKQEIEHNIQPTIIERRDGRQIELGATAQVDNLKEVGEGRDESNSGDR